MRVLLPLILLVLITGDAFAQRLPDRSQSSSIPGTAPSENITRPSRLPSPDQREKATSSNPSTSTVPSRQNTPIQEKKPFKQRSNASPFISALDNSDENAEPGEIIILANLNERGRIESYAIQNNYTVTRNHTLPTLGQILLVIRVKNNNVSNVISQLRQQFPDASIDRNHHLFPSSGPPRIYAPKKIKWNNGESCTKNLKKIPIGLIDGQIDLNHPAFDGQKIIQKSFIQSGKPDENHGTAIASILIGNAPNKGYAGLIPGAKLYSASVLRTLPKGDELANVESLSLAIDWLLKNKVRLINISLTTDKQNIVLEKIFKVSSTKQALPFAAAGNEGPRAPPSYPAAYKQVIAVTAIDVADRIYKHANHGAYIDVAAPGVDIWVAQNNNTGAYKSGTSYAAPYALAVAAQALTLNTSLSEALLMANLKQTTKDLGANGHDNVYGWGLIQSGNCKNINN